ncbi:hypothetical protein KSC_013010 [Ktedonobacter sp. SOSP1-52]|nr:hypothetical protein KSC_013010 [Ktedonobacter sp. SOSP1-52]
MYDSTYGVLEKSQAICHSNETSCAAKARAALWILVGPTPVGSEVQKIPEWVHRIQVTGSLSRIGRCVEEKTSPTLLSCLIGYARGN